MTWFITRAVKIKEQEILSTHPRVFLEKPTLDVGDPT